MINVLDEIQEKIITAIVLFLVTVSIGVAGYRVLAPGNSLLDCLYMTIITLSTVGFGEAIDLTDNTSARIFTMILIMFGMGNLLYVVSTMTSVITDGELQGLLRRRKMQKRINKLKNHIIVCGVSNLSKNIIEELIRTHNDFVVISNNNEELSSLSATFKELLFVIGDPSHNNVMISAGIEHATGIITVLADDKDNLLAVVTARKLNPDLRIISSVNEHDNIEKFKTVGVDSTIAPDLIGGLRIVSEMLRPCVVTFLDVMLRDSDDNTRFEDILVSKDSHLVNQTLRDSRIRDKTGLLVVSIKKPGMDTFIYNPSPDEVLVEDTVLIVIGSVDEVAQLKQLAEG